MCESDQVLFLVRTFDRYQMDAEILLEINIFDRLPDKSGRCLDLIEMFRIGYFIPMPEQAPKDAWEVYIVENPLPV